MSLPLGRTLTSAAVGPAHSNHLVFGTTRNRYKLRWCSLCGTANHTLLRSSSCTNSFLNTTDRLHIQIVATCSTFPRRKFWIQACCHVCHYEVKLPVVTHFSDRTICIMASRKRVVKPLLIVLWKHIFHLVMLIRSENEDRRKWRLGWRMGWVFKFHLTFNKRPW